MTGNIEFDEAVERVRINMTQPQMMDAATFVAGARVAKLSYQFRYVTDALGSNTLS